MKNSQAVNIDTVFNPLKVDKPSNFKSTIIDPNTLKLSWDKLTNADRYYISDGDTSIYYDKESEFVYKNFTQGSEHNLVLKSEKDGFFSEGTSIVIDSTGKAQTSLGKLKSPKYDEATNVSPLNEVKNIKEKGPENFRITSVVGEDPIIRWDGNNAGSYVLYKNGLKQYEGVDTETKDKPLQNLNRYRYELYSKSDKKISNPSILDFMYLTWDKNEGDSYVLKRNGKVIYQGEGNAFNDVEVSPSQNYSYSLEISNGRSIKTVDLGTIDTLPNAVNNATLVKTAPGVAQLSWDSISDDSNEYRIFIKGIVSTDWEAASPIEATGFEDNKIYDVKILVRNSKTGNINASSLNLSVQDNQNLE